MSPLFKNNSNFFAPFHFYSCHLQRHVSSDVASFIKCSHVRFFLPQIDINLLGCGNITNTLAYFLETNFYFGSLLPCIWLFNSEFLYLILKSCIKHLIFMIKYCWLWKFLISDIIGNITRCYRKRPEI